MTSHEEPPPDRPPEPGDPEFTIARSKTVIPLLALFALTVLWVVVTIVRSEPPAPPHGAIADRAYGPADFPAIFAGAPVPPPAGDTDGSTKLFPVAAPPFSDGIFPCSDCHADMEPDPTRRELTTHDEIKFEHDAEHRWCLDCHDPGDRDQLHLANGTKIPFTESYQLCGQCHGTQYRDWRIGIHGKRTGSWNGTRQYLLCVHCHNPHSPAFKALQPLPPPIRPQFLHVAARGDAGADPGPTPEEGPDAHATR